MRGVKSSGSGRSQTAGADRLATIQWPVSGYGKSELLRDPEDAVQRAAIGAMREAGATISTKFSEQPQVKQWLGGKGYGAPVAVGPQAATEPLE